ncbi:hypothetical protein AAMO2058_001614300 [Amorphochlora amoebiformis]
MQRSRIKKMISSDPDVGRISDLAVYAIEGSIAACIKQILNEVEKEAKARNHRTIGDQHLKYCLEKFPPLHTIAGKVVLNAPPIDAPEPSTKRKRLKGQGMEGPTKDIGYKKGLDTYESSESD